MSNSLALAVRGRSSDGISQPRVISDHPSSPFISEIEHCREKRFRQKLYGFEGDIRWYHWFDLEELLYGHMKVIFNFLNRTYYFSLHILLFFSSGAFSPAVWSLCRVLVCHGERVGGI